MKLHKIFCLLFFVCINSNTNATNDTITNCSCPAELKFAHFNNTLDETSWHQGPSPDPLASTTALINSLNNNIATENKYLTAINIIIAVLALSIAGLGVVSFFGIKGFNESKREIKKYKNDVDETINKKIGEINGVKEKIDEMLKEQSFQNQYLKRINQYLFSITNSVVDNLGDNNERARGIRESLYRQYYIVKAFLPWSDSLEDGTVAVFRYLQNNGTKDQIGDLQFIADNDPDERKKNIAHETIGAINSRNN